MLINHCPQELTIFGMRFSLLWQKIEPVLTELCTHNQWVLNIPNIASFLVRPKEHEIIIDKMNDDVSIHILNTWLYGSISAFILQYYGYLVLHGSAILMNGKAVLISGQSGAGKSTLAGALWKKGYPFITDDLIVIKQDEQGRYGMLQGPNQLKLWKDAMHYLDQDMSAARPVMLKTDKYALPVPATNIMTMIPIDSFYELDIGQKTYTPIFTPLNSLQSFKTLMQNVYRYFMLKPLNQLHQFFNDCHALSKQITVSKIERTHHFSDLAQIIRYIETKQGIL